MKKKIIGKVDLAAYSCIYVNENWSTIDRQQMLCKEDMPWPAGGCEAPGEGTLRKQIQAIC